MCAQQSKEYKETFLVGDATILELNTSHADIEFETWSKDQVEVIATVTLEDVTEEEAQSYFEKDRVNILGNSKKIDVSTASKNSWNFYSSDVQSDVDFNVETFFETLELPDLPELAVLPEMPPMPPMPPMNIKEFDYKAFKKDGDKYLKKWNKTFMKNFDEEYQKEMEEWAEMMEERTKEWEEKNANRIAKMEERAEQRAAEFEKRKAERMARLEERFADRAAEMEKRAQEMESRAFVFRSNAPSASEANIFYFKSNDANKKYKVKTSIKIKMPKSVTLKMNVKHGEVKLAESTKNLKANLRYASLLAPTIEGKETRVEASYSPLFVTDWEHGTVEAKYCKPINLEKVNTLKINSVSSEVVIGTLLNDIEATNEMGTLNIAAIQPSTRRIFVNVNDGELQATVPKEGYSLYLFDDYSNVVYPKKIEVQRIDTPLTSSENMFFVKDKRKSQPLLSTLNTAKLF